MNRTFCNGCGREFGIVAFDRVPALTGERSNGSAGGGVPSGTFHLCIDCGRIAFAALKGTHGAAAG
jgi:hypothetical protein